MGSRNRPVTDSDIRTGQFFKSNVDLYRETAIYSKLLGSILRCWVGIGTSIAKLMT